MAKKAPKVQHNPGNYAKPSHASWWANAWIKQNPVVPKGKAGKK